MSRPRFRARCKCVRYSEHVATEHLVLCHSTDCLTEIVARAPSTHCRAGASQFGELLSRRSTLVRDRVSHYDDGSKNATITVSSLQSSKRPPTDEKLPCALDALFRFSPRQEWGTF